MPRFAALPTIACGRAPSRFFLAPCPPGFGSAGLQPVRYGILPERPSSKNQSDDTDSRRSSETPDAVAVPDNARVAVREQDARADGLEARAPVTRSRDRGRQVSE
jgi:hypothetical protein